MIGPDVPVVVSIATIPSRIAHIRPTLESLLVGNRAPDLILVNAPEFCKLEQSGYDVPDFLADSAVFGDRVRFVQCATDWGPGTKILGPIPHLPPECILVIADDDIIYHPEFLERLVTAQRQHPDHAYSFWVYRSSGLSIGQGCDGVSIWSPNLAGIEAFAQRHVAGTTLAYHDDIWIAFFLAVKGVKVRMLPVPPAAELVYEQVLPNTVLATQTGQLKRELILKTHLPRLLREGGAPPSLRVRLAALGLYDNATSLTGRVVRKLGRIASARGSKEA